MTPHVVRPRSLVAGLPAVLLSVLLAVTASGCAGPPVRGAAGVDGLTVPTPDPRPGDFVSVVDNPWSPYPQGAQWTYREMLDGGILTIVVLAGSGPVIDDVPTTAVTTRVEAGAPDDVDRSPVRTTVDYVAQDRSGNVWWFGREGEWLAGADGAEAGLLMAAQPRLGDGYAEGPEQAGIAEVTDVDVDGTGFLAANGQVYDRTVQLTVVTSTDTLVQTYARGVGLVQQVSVSDTLGLGRTQGPRELVEYQGPP